MDKLKSRDLWIGIVAGIIVALAAAFGVTVDQGEVADALDDVVVQIDHDTDSDTVVIMAEE